MASVRIKLNKKTVKKMARSPEMLAVVTDRAQKILDAAGEGFVMESRIGRVRARASVRTFGYEGKEREATERALTRAIDAGKRAG
jgi:hypothetical protein